MKETTYFLASVLMLVVASVWGIYTILDSDFLDDFYIFEPSDLQTVALRSVQQHGNNTKALVSSIVDQLRADDSIAPYLTQTEEWMFNNAGGAMGAMYIIHASTSRAIDHHLRIH